MGRPRGIGSLIERWALALRDPGYLRMALPGLVLIITSGLLWGRGWWTFVLLIGGLVLVRLRFPPKQPLRQKPR